VQLSWSAAAKVRSESPTIYWALASLWLNGYCT
jgi:hypothetical protein